ncbi:MAG TPA: transcription antitermination factor NusB, partial [Nitrosospira sp.]
MTPAKPPEKSLGKQVAGPVAQTAGRHVVRKGRKTRRRLSRELALQGLYQWCVAGGTAGTIAAQLHETSEFAKTDGDYFGELLRGVLGDAAELETLIQPYLDRPFKELSPVEISILLMGTHELKSHPEMPYRAVINEAVELAKTYGGT